MSERRHPNIKPARVTGDMASRGSFGVAAKGTDLGKLNSGTLPKATP